MILIIVGLIIFLFVGLVAINLLYKRTCAYKNEQIPYNKFCIGVPQNLKLSIFGSTYALYGFDGIEDLQLNAFNFALPSQSLEIDKILLHKYADRISSGSIVIFCLAACVSYYRYDMVADKTFYYSFLSKKEIPSFSVVDKMKYIFPLYGKRVKSSIRIFLDVPIRTSIYGNSVSCVSPTESKNNMKGMAETWIKLFALKDLIHANSNKTNQFNLSKNTLLLRNMFQFCIDRSLHPVVVIPPFSSELNMYFGDEFIKNSLYKMIEDAMKGLDVPILDYRTNIDFQRQDSLYIDGGFRLSKYGSIKLIKMVLDDLSSLGYNLTNKTIGK